MEVAYAQHPPGSAMAPLSTMSPQDLDVLTYADLESIKTHLDSVRQHILALQNAQSPLLRLPGELRNKIFAYALRADLADRRNGGRRGMPPPQPASHLFREPAWLATSRQVRAECTGVWFADVLIWEEWIAAAPSTECPEEEEGQGGGEWKRVPPDEVKAMCCAKSKVGTFTLVAQPSYGALEKTRQAVEESKSVCPRKGLVRAGGNVDSPQMKWWVW